MLYDELRIHKGRVVSKTKDAVPNIDLLRMYQQKIEAAIDEGDREEMKRWSRELFKSLTGDANSELPIGNHDDVPDTDFDKQELAKGIKHEMEHTSDPAVAKSIAKDHLVEIADYYTRLEKMESEAHTSDDGSSPINVGGIRG